MNEEENGKEKEERVQLLRIKDVEKRRKEFIDNVVYVFVSVGTSNHLPDDDEIATYLSFIRHQFLWGTDTFKEKLGKISREHNELVEKEEIEKYNEKKEKWEKEHPGESYPYPMYSHIELFNKAVDKLLGENLDTWTAPEQIITPGGISITLVVRETEKGGTTYRVMKLS